MQGHIYRKKSPDGSWSRWYAVIDHPGVDGKRRQKTSTHETKRDAQAWLAQVVAELRAGQVYDTTVTVQEYLTGWLAGKQSLRPSTRLSYRCHIHQYLIPHLGHHRLSALRAHHLEAMYLAITSGNHQRERPVGPETLRRIHATCQSALNTAVKRGLLRRNPAATVELVRIQRPRRTTWNERDAATFLTAIVDDPLHPLYRMLLITGLRRGEALGLRWCDLDVQSSVLHVRQQLVAVGTDLVIGPPKTASGARTIALDEKTLQALQLHALEAHLTPAGQLRQSPEDLVFSTTVGAPLCPAYVSRHFDRIVHRTELPRIRLHDLRHTSASLGLAGGETLLEVSKRLGHSSIGVTADIYSHITPQVARQAADRLADILDHTT